MQQVAPGGVGQQVALYLDTYVAAIAGVATSPVSKTGYIVDNLAVAHKALLDGVHGVLKGKGPLELASLNAEVSIFLPFGKEVYHAWRTA